MYNNIFQEYINKMIGGTSIFEITGNSYSDFQNQTNKELESLYPELYKLLYPMIKTACMRNTKPITAETIEEMVKEIYSNFHNEEMPQASTKTKTKEIETNKGEKTNNALLKDLIRILLIKEILENQRNRQLVFRPEIYFG